MNFKIDPSMQKVFNALIEGKNINIFVITELEHLGLSIANFLNKTVPKLGICRAHNFFVTL